MNNTKIQHFAEPCSIISITSDGESSSNKSKHNVTKLVFGHYQFKMWDKNGAAIYHGNIANMSQYLYKNHLRNWMVCENACYNSKLVRDIFRNEVIYAFCLFTIFFLLR